MGAYEARSHGKLIDETRVCQSPVRGGYRQCRNAPTLDSLFCPSHDYDAERPTREPEPGYVWEALTTKEGLTYYWFQRRTPNAKRRALLLDRGGRVFSGSSSVRSEIRGRP